MTKKNNLKIETVANLERWMIENNFQKNSFTIGDYFFTTEGFGLDNNGGIFSWFYTERGERETIKYFRNEKEAIEYIFEQINKKE